MIGTAIAGIAMMAVGGTIGAVGQYMQGQEAKKAANAQAKLAESQAAQQEAQAKEYERAAELENQKAGIEQMKGEQEAAEKMRQRAAAIGSAYAEAAGNGILVDGTSSDDTFGNILKTRTIEDTADLNTIRANTAMNVWSREEDARSYLFAAGQQRQAAQDSLFSASEYRRQGKSAARAGTLSAIGSLHTAAGSTMLSSVGAFKK